MTRQVIALTSPEALRGEIERLEAKLAEAKQAIVDGERQLAEAREALASVERAEAAQVPQLREQILAFASVRGEITLTQLRYLYPDEPVHHIERALTGLVHEGWLEDSGELGVPAGGRGRAPKVYVLRAPPKPDGHNKPAISKRRASGRYPTQT